LVLFKDISIFFISLKNIHAHRLPAMLAVWIFPLQGAEYKNTCVRLAMPVSPDL
jgi:hypothetical protein